MSKIMRNGDEGNDHEENSAVAKLMNVRQFFNEVGGGK